MEHLVSALDPAACFNNARVSGVEESVVEILERSTQSLSVLLLHTALNEAFHQNDSFPSSFVP